MYGSFDNFGLNHGSRYLPGQYCPQFNFKGAETNSAQTFDMFKKPLTYPSQNVDSLKITNPVKPKEDSNTALKIGTAVILTALAAYGIYKGKKLVQGSSSKTFSNNIKTGSTPKPSAKPPAPKTTEPPVVKNEPKPPVAKPEVKPEPAPKTPASKADDATLNAREAKEAKKAQEAQEAKEAAEAIKTKEANKAEEAKKAQEAIQAEEAKKHKRQNKLLKKLQKKQRSLR